MAVWDGTLIGFTVSGADLQMDDYVSWAQYLTDKQDVGSLDHFRIETIYTWAKTAGDLNGASAVVFEMSFSEDDITYSDYEEYHNHERYFRYFYLRITAYTDPASLTPPKITALETVCRPSRGHTALAGVLSTTVLTPPGGEELGDRWLINGVGAGAWLNEGGKVAECVESTTPTFVFHTVPDQARIPDAATGRLWMLENSKLEQPYCLQGRKPVGSAVEVAINGALTTVLEVTGLAGRFNHDTDEFFIKLHYTTGAPFGVGDQVRIQIDDGAGGGYITAFNIVPGVAVSQDVFFRFHITRGAVNTDCIVDHHATDTNAGVGNGLTNTAGVFVADWMSSMTKIKVLAMSDAGALAECWIYADQNI